MAKPIGPPSGMRDFLPSEKARREDLLAEIRSEYQRHGFDEIETPVLEESSRLHSGLGGDNEKLAFGVLRRGLTRSDWQRSESALDLVDLGLRYDLTVPLARFYAAHRAELPTVFKSIQIAPVWRAERPQKGRFRQFVQCDIDIIGDSSQLAEVELLVATASALRKIGLTKCTIRINDRRILDSYLDLWNVPYELRAAALVSIDKFDKIGREGVLDDLFQLGAITTQSVGGVSALLSVPPQLGSEWALDGLEGLPPIAREIFNSLRRLAQGVRALTGLRVEFDPTLVRGMGYYTGTIFEIKHADLSYSLGGGGRYDDMIGRYLGERVPAVGMSLGFERIVDLAKPKLRRRTAAAVVFHDPEHDPFELANLKRHLLRKFRRVRLERKPRNLRKALDRLNAERFTTYTTVHPGVSPTEPLFWRDMIEDAWSPDRL